MSDDHRGLIEAAKRRAEVCDDDGLLIARLAEALEQQNERCDWPDEYEALKAHASAAERRVVELERCYARLVALTGEGVLP